MMWICEHGKDAVCCQVCNQQRSVSDALDSVTVEKDAQIQSLKAELAVKDAELERHHEHRNRWYKHDAEQQTEIERLKGEHMRKMVRVTDDCARALAALNDRATVYQSRAQAWKKAAIQWKEKLEANHQVHGRLKEGEFLGINKHGPLITLIKAPPDWREKWVTKPKAPK